MLLIRADVLVEADDIQCLAERVVDDLGVALGAHQQRRGNQAVGSSSRHGRQELQ